MRLWLALFPILACLGCVSSGTHEALQKDYKAAQEKITSLEVGITKLVHQRDDLQRQVLELGNRISVLAGEKAIALADNARVQKDKANLLGDKARMLKDKAMMKASIEEMKNALAELERRKRQADARIAEFKRLVERFKPLVDAGKLRVKIVEGRMVVELATDILFDSGKADLSESGLAAIQEVAGVLAGLGDKRFQVEGHTDDVPIKNARFASNWDLAAARALTVVNTMVGAGLPANRVSGASYAEFTPAADNQTDAGKARNRRIEIVVVPDLSTLPGFEELQKMGRPNG